MNSPVREATAAKSAPPREKTPVFIIILITAGALLTAGAIAAFALDAAAHPDRGGANPGDATLVITSEPAGALVTIGGKEQGTTPLAVTLAPGSKYAVFVEMDGYETYYESVTLESGEKRTLFVTFDETNRAEPATRTICGIWRSVDPVPDKENNYYTLYYEFAEDGSGKEYWYADAKTKTVSPFTWETETNRYKITYDANSGVEYVKLSRDGSFLIDAYGYSYRKAETLPSVTFGDGALEPGADETYYTRTFTWHACGTSWNYTITFPKSAYEQYAAEPRHLNQYLHYTAEPYNRALAKKIAADFLEQTEAGFSRDELFASVCAFVQSLPYVSDLESTGLREYYRYPVETLCAGFGDCEDKSFLLAAVLKEMGCDVALIRFDDHMGIGIAGVESGGAYFEYDGRKYYYLETTANGLGVGDMPDEMLGKSAKVFYVE